MTLRRIPIPTTTEAQLREAYDRGYADGLRAAAASAARTVMHGPRTPSLEGESYSEWCARAIRERA